MEYYYREDKIRVFLDGNSVMEDLKYRQNFHEDEGWEPYGSVVSIPTESPEEWLMVYKYRRAKR